MCAVNPSRIGKSFSDAALREVVDTVSQQTNLLLEVVNFNVKGQQYVYAGELLALETLTKVLNYLDKAKEKQKAEGHIKLEQGFPTILLPGIDVPFHSHYLWAGVMPFCAYLSKKINSLHLNPDLLVGKYIPCQIPFARVLHLARVHPA